MHLRSSFLHSAGSIILLRVVLSTVFLAHAITRVALNTIPEFGGFLESKGFPMGNLIVWGITIFEIAGGILLMFGIFQKWISIGLIAMLLTGIALIHFQLGWFNGEFGTGGCEYSVTLIAALIVVASATPATPSKKEKDFRQTSTH
jgi:putative oxidoreductase